MVGIYKSSTIPYVSRSADFTNGTAIVLIWLVAEVTATIIAASIPFFRPLLRRGTSAKGTKDSYGMSRMTNRSRGGWGAHSKLGSQADARGDATYEYSSDKDILPPDSKIVRKTNVTVEYDRYSADGEKGEQSYGRGHRDMF